MTLHQTGYLPFVFQEIISHWHPNITVNIVSDFTNWVPGQVNAKHVSKFVRKLRTTLRKCFTCRRLERFLKAEENIFVFKTH
jgi:hypothetical protein